MNYTLKKNEIAKAIAETVAYFDIFDYPLTCFEIWKYSPEKCELNDIEKILAAGGNGLDSKDGFYFLADREEIIRIRRKRRETFAKKIKIAARAVRYLKLIPWLKMIAIGNIMGAHNLKSSGDIDFFIVTKRGRIWLARFFSIIFVKLMDLRPQKNNIKDKICLSFFIAEDSMCLKDLMLSDEAGGKDAYFIYWLSGLKPIYEIGGWYEKLIEKNLWLKNYLPNWEATKPLAPKKDGSALFRLLKNTASFLFSPFEPLARIIQKKIMPPDMKILMNKDTRVVISDKIIKTHINDRRELYRKLWREKINKMNNENYE
jgi:hypothetical protein